MQPVLPNSSQPSCSRTVSPLEDMATSAATLMKVIEVMVDARPKTVDKAIEILGGEGLLPAKLLANRIEVKPRKESRFASVEAEMFAVQQKISIPEGFRGSGKAGEGGKITIVDLRDLLLGKTEPKVAKAPKEPKEPKEPKVTQAAKAPKAEPVEDPRITKKVRELLHSWGLDEGALAGCKPTAYKGAKFGVGDIAHLEPGLETGGKGKGKKPKMVGVAVKAASAASASSASDSDSGSDTTEEQDDEFDPFAGVD